MEEETCLVLFFKMYSSLFDSMRSVNRIRCHSFETDGCFSVRVAVVACFDPSTFLHSVVIRDYQFWNSFVCLKTNASLYIMATGVRRACAGE